MSEKESPYWLNSYAFHLDAVKNEIALWQLLEEMNAIEIKLRRHQEHSKKSASDSSNP